MIARKNEESRREWKGPGNRGLLVKDGRYLDTEKLNPFIFNALNFDLTHPQARWFEREFMSAIFSSIRIGSSF